MRRLTKDEFVEKAKKKHGDIFDYSKFIYKNNSIKGIIICSKHGEFLQNANNHLTGSGCKMCSLSFYPSSDGFIESARKIHGFKYDYTKTDFLCHSSKLKIICYKHGEFWQKASSHISGRGCPGCGLKKMLTTEEFIARSKEKHGDLYGYEKAKYRNSDTKVEIICRSHGSFFQRSLSHIKGAGCRKCLFDRLSNITISKSQEEFLKYLGVDNVNYRIGRYIVDGFKDNCVYEFLGDYWHSNPIKFNHDNIHPHYKKTHGEVYRSTFHRLEEIRKMGYKIKYIWEFNWNIFKKGGDLKIEELLGDA